MNGFLTSRHRQLLRPFVFYSAYHKQQHTRSINIFSVFNKEAVEKERLRLKDELNRGYFDDYRDLKKHGGKLATASQALVPIAASVKFPALEVKTANGEQLILPSGKKPEDETVDSSMRTPATLVCVAFRASAQGLVKSWISPFASSFQSESNVGVIEVSYVDSWLLSLSPIRPLMLRAMQSSGKQSQVERRQVVFAFGDSYDFRKTLHITNLLTGYIFLLDKQGRVRWRAYGQSTDEEISSMISCTHQLLDEQKDRS